ncbi:MAG: hypothetical protein AAGH76_05400 [Pseudomonadota bacterium]
MKRLICLLALIGTLAGMPAIAAANTPAPDGFSAERPRRGMSMASVERQYGTPDTKRAAVGEPPISRWVYAQFTVYFEHDKVVHAVINR